MLYYSEKTKKNYKTVEELEKAETALEERKTKRQKDAETLKELEKKAVSAKENYEKALSEFIDEYGTYKTTITKDSYRPSMFSPLFESIASPFGADLFKYIL